MNPDLLTRLLWAAAIVALGVSSYFLANRWVLARAQSKVAEIKTASRGKPVLLYFTTPTCAPCKTIQRPAIQHLQNNLGDQIQVVEIDASSQPEIASQWGVMSVPSTFIIDPQGKPRYVNHGVTSAEKLFRQIQNIR